MRSTMLEQKRLNALELLTIKKNIYTEKSKLITNKGWTLQI